MPNSPRCAACSTAAAARSCAGRRGSARPRCWPRRARSPRVPVYSATGSELERIVPVRRASSSCSAPCSAEPTQAVLHELYWLVADRCPAVLLVDDAHWVDRAVAALARVHGQPGRRPAAGDRARRPRRRAGRAAGPDRAALGDDRARAAPAVGAPPWRSWAATPPCSRPPAATRSTSTRCSPATPRSVVESVALRLAALPPACTALARALSVRERNGRGTRRRARRGVGGRRRSRRSPAPTSCAATTSPTRSCARRSTPRSRRPSARGSTWRRRACSTTPEHVAAQLMAAGPGGGVWAVEALRAAARAAWARGAPDVAAAFLRRAAEEEMPRAQLVGAAARARPRAGRGRGPGRAPGPAPGARAGRAGRARRDRGRARPVAVQPGVLRRRVRGLRGRRRRGRAGDRGGARPVARAALRRPRRDRRARARDRGRARGSRSRARRTRTAPQHAEAALADPDIEPSDLAAGLVALMAAGRHDQAEARWSAVAESARAAGALDTLRLAVALRALVRLRLGRVAETEADLRELIAWVAELQLPLASYRTALPFVVAPLIDALVERGELEEAGALARAHRARGRLAGGVRLHVPDRQPRAAAARAGPRPRRAAPRARVRAPPARVGHPQPGLRRVRLDARRGAGRDRPHVGGARRLRRADRPRAPVRRRARGGNGADRAGPDHRRSRSRCAPP